MQFLQRPQRVFEKNAKRLHNKNRSRFFRKFFSNAIMIAIGKEKSGIDFAGKNGDRFSGKNRDPAGKS